VTGSLSLLERCLWALSTACTVALIVRLWRERLYTVYRFLFAYLILDVLLSVVLSQLSPKTYAYGLIFIVSQPVLWFLYILITLELYTLVLGSHPGIATLGRRFVQVAMAMAIGGAALSTWFIDLKTPTRSSPVLQYTFVLNRAVTTSVVIFLFVIVCFLVWFPVRLNRNVVAYCVGYFVFFLSKSFVLLTRNLLGPDWTRTLSTLMLGISCLCLIFWIAALRRKAEDASVVSGHRWRRQDEDRLIEQLDAINASLHRIARK